MKKILTVTLILLLILPVFPVSADTLTASVKIGEVNYRDPNVIYLTDDELSVTENNVTVTEAASFEESGSETLLLTDMKKAPVFNPSKNTVIYTLAQKSGVSGIRLIKDSTTKNMSADIYASEDGTAWYKIGSLLGTGDTKAETDFGFNLAVLKIAVVFTSELSSIKLSDMHLIKEKTEYAYINVSDTEKEKVYVNGNDTGGFRVVADTELENVPATNLIDGDYSTYWHSDYDVINGEAVAKQKLPHTVTIDFGKGFTLSGIRYIPRNGGSKVTCMAVYGSSDGSEFYKISESSTWTYTDTADQTPKVIDFGENYSLRALKVVVLKTQSNVYSTGAEIEFLRPNMSYGIKSAIDELSFVDKALMSITGPYGIEKAFDLSEKTKFESSDTLPLSFTADFGKTVSVRGLRYTSEEGVKINGADVYVSDDGKNFNKFITSEFSDNFELLFKCNIRAKAIRIDITKTSTALSVKEFKFLSGEDFLTEISLSEEIAADSSWKISATSEMGYAPVKNLIDGDVNTIWHSWFDGSSGNQDWTPIDVEIEFGHEIEISGFNYYPRRTGTAGCFNVAEIYITDGEKNGKIVWDKVEDVTLTYSTGTFYESKRAEFTKNYKVDRLKIRITNGNGGYATGAEIKFLKANSSKKVKYAEALKTSFEYDLEEPEDIFIPIALNESIRVTSFTYSGKDVPKDYYSLTDEGIMLSKYFFGDITSTNKHDENFTLEFLQGDPININVSVAGVESYTVKFETGEGGSVTAETTSPLGVKKEVVSGNLVKRKDSLVFTAVPDDGYFVSGWKILNETPVLEKIMDRSGYTVLASTEYGDSVMRIFDNKDNTYWHSGYTIVGENTIQEEKDKKPFYITIILPTESEIAGITYLPRQDSDGGKIKDYEIYSSSDGENYDKLIGSGCLSYLSQTDRTEKTMVFDETVKTKFIKIKIISTSGTFGHIAELWLLKEKPDMTGKVTYSGTKKTEFKLDDLFTDAKIITEFSRLTGEAKVSYDLSEVLTDNTSTVKKGEDASWTFSAINGYNLPEKITVISDGSTLIQGVDYLYTRILGNEGLYDSGTLLIKNVTGDINITVKGVDYNTAVLRYTEKYGATGAIPATREVRKGSATVIDKSNLTLLGYKFIGWKSSYDEKTYKEGEKFNMPECDVTLTAVWEAVAIKDLGGGSSGGSSGSKKSPQGSSGGGIGGGTEGLYNITIGDKKINALPNTVIADPEPKEGYIFGGYYLDAELTVPYANTGVNGSVTLYPSWIKERNSSDISDIKGHWAEDMIAELYEKGIIQGAGDGKFNPDFDITRAEFVQILYNISGMVTNGYEEFDDVKSDDWFAVAVSWAVNNGIINGTGNGNFSPYVPITREQTTVIIYRFLTFMGMDWEIGQEEEFADSDSISDYAKYEVKWAKINGIVSGRPDGTFAPGDRITRAEAATMILRAIKKLG